jgi:hypothetical protein
MALQTARPGGCDPENRLNRSLLVGSDGQDPRAGIRVTGVTFCRFKGGCTNWFEISTFPEFKTGVVDVQLGKRIEEGSKNEDEA